MLAQSPKEHSTMCKRDVGRAARGHTDLDVSLATSTHRTSMEVPVVIKRVVLLYISSEGQLRKCPLPSVK